jgi:hypothetical protein
MHQLCPALRYSIYAARRGSSESLAARIRTAEHIKVHLKGQDGR